MKTFTTIWRSVAVVALALLLGATFANAQSQSGNLYGTAADDKGAALPGVTVTLSGQGAPQVQTTDAEGQFRFLGLSPGSYAIKAELQGFSTVDYPNVVVSVGRNTNIEVKLAGAVEDVITVTAESPLLDERKISASTTVSQTELAKIPTARDPWALLQSTPGVLTDRINVGGNESGQQSNFVGPGSMGTQATFALDGMVITDMSATGSSPGYFDFDSFEELQITTGGADTTVATPGVTLNMVTKRGTNEWRGSGRYFYTDDSLQSDLSFSKSDLGKSGPWNGGNPAQGAFKQGNRIDKIMDYGLELGGPIVKDKLWIWGAYAKPKINLLTVNDFFDKTTLEDTNVKLNWQIVQANSLTGFYFNSDKVKLGRNASPTRPQETTFDQGKFGPSPTAYKVEDTHIFSSDFYLTGMYSKVNGGFELVPEGGDKPFYNDEGGVWHNSFFLIQILRPQEQAKLDASTFFTTGSINHELKFGAGHRTADQETFSRTQGGFYEILGTGSNKGKSFYAVARDENVSVSAKYDNAFVQDTLSVGNLTANVGLRYDKQGGSNNAKTVEANRFLPNVLPAVNYAGGGAGFEWKSITPRLGLTYALGADRKTLLRASFSQFADQLGTPFIAQNNPLGLQSYAYFYYLAQGKGTTLPPGLGPNNVNYYSPNVNPETGGLLVSNAVEKGLDAPLTSEVLLGVEHALLPEFVVGLNLTYRKYTGILESERLVFDCADGGNSCAYDHANLNQVGRTHRRSDYVEVATQSGTDPNGHAYSNKVYALRPGVSTRNGNLLENGDREQEYKGASVTFTKRLSNRWMLRGNFTFSDWKWQVPSSELEDPNRTIADSTDGQPVIQGSGTGSGAKGSVYINSKWAYSVNALYQIAPDRPWGFNVAGNLTGRQGYPEIYFTRSATQNTGQREFQPTTAKTDASRYDDIRQLDLRIEKDFTFGDFGMTLGVDCFNVLNQSTVLQRQGRIGLTTSGFVTEIVSPRLFRVGAKFNFR